ncbi:MAG: class B sortase [Acutalibacteraceae bacterium]
MSKKKNKTPLVIILILLICAFVGAVSYIGYRIVSNYMAEKQLDVVAPTTASTETSADIPDNPVDFKSLQKKNKDIVGWIKIEDTKVNYPVLRPSDGDDGFYLHHDMNKNYLFAGSIYMESANSSFFDDRNTILYGHNMNAGTMFASLHKFEDKSFFDKHKTFEVYTPGHILTYQIFSAYEYDNRHILNSFDFTDDIIWADYLDMIQNPESGVKNTRKVSLDKESKILTLSTCTNFNANKRYLVQGVLTKDVRTK